METLKNGFLLFSGLAKEIRGLKWVKPPHKYTLRISTQDFSVFNSIFELRHTSCLFSLAGSPG